MANRAVDWLKQAERDLEQAAEKAVKALHLNSGREAWGDIVAKLLGGLPNSGKVPFNM